jgi:sporulation protein YlmC with PRC-barrel domain
MANESTNTLKLGIFVLAGTAVLVLGLYLLGAKRDLFSRTLDVSAEFKQVNGLRVGNNVRYAGIDVGTVQDITIMSDTLVVVQMMIRRDDAAHIRTDAVAEHRFRWLDGQQAGEHRSRKRERRTVGGRDRSGNLAGAGYRCDVAYPGHVQREPGGHHQ